MVDVAGRNRDNQGRFANEHQEPGISLEPPAQETLPARMLIEAALIAAESGQDDLTAAAVAEAYRTGGGAGTLGSSEIAERFEASVDQTPAGVLAKAERTRLNPYRMGHPFGTSGRVELIIDESVAERMTNYDVDDLDRFTEIYADVDVFGGESDLWGVTREGKEEIIRLGVHGLDDHIDLDGELQFRAGFDDPRPARQAAVKAWDQERLESSRTLLDALGVTVEQSKYQEYNLTNTDGVRLRMTDDMYGRGIRLTETTNWRMASESDLEAFLGGPVDKEARKMLELCGAIVGRDLGGVRY